MHAAEATHRGNRQSKQDEQEAVRPPGGVAEAEVEHGVAADERAVEVEHDDAAGITDAHEVVRDEGACRSM